MGQLILRPALVGGITGDFRKATRAFASIVQPHEDAVGPETGAVFPEMKTAIKDAAFVKGNVDFLFHFPVPAVLPRENQCARLPNSFLLRPSKDTLRACAPKRDRVFRVEQKHRVIPRPFDEDPEALFAFPQGFLRPLAMGDVVHAIDRAEDVTLVILQGSRRDSHTQLLAIVAFDNDFQFARVEFLAAQDPRHGTLVVRHEGPIRVIHLERAAKLVAISARRSPPHLDRAMVVLLDDAVRVCHVNRYRHQVEQGPVTQRAAGDLFLGRFHRDRNSLC
jgi:hypothetical protein